MTREEKMICDIMWQKDISCEIIQKVRETLEKAEKYKWHDLRKNIDDLPDTNVDKVLVQYSNGEVWTNLPDNVPFSLDIIRWKYIDIEEEEE